MTYPTAPPRLFGDAYAARPHEAIEQLRSLGPVAWAEIDEGVHALVVTSHRAALDLLHDTATYSKDARLWWALNNGHIPPNSPVLALMAWRPSLLYADDATHQRLRVAMDDCLGRIDLHELEEIVRRHAATLISRVAPSGEVDVMADYADTVPLLAFADLLGCPEDVGVRLVKACQGVINAGPGAGLAAQDLIGCLAEVVALKRQQPGRDITTWMLTHHAQLTDEELLNQLFVVVGAGTIPTAAWIGQSVRLLLSDEQYSSTLAGGAVTVRRAMEQTLRTHSPMANFSVHFARRDTILHGIQIPARVPVMISHQAANTDPALPAHARGARDHLAWSAGPHRCPAVGPATRIAQVAVETILDQLWAMHLTEESVPNRPGPFHQCPIAVHATFKPATAAALIAAAPSPGGTA
ncbi:cytochrome P450 [Streptomyces sp. NPDC058268]|uniref:cytochrome P450 n=1 Tax=Streptomyces sp. NPDC058268 TaxID=3346413 RepID=UPI0036E553C5